MAWVAADSEEAADSTGVEADSEVAGAEEAGAGDSLQLSQVT